VHLLGDAALIGHVAPVRILAAHTNSLSGTLVTQAGVAGAGHDPSQPRTSRRAEEPAPA
jgi:hypothetical protein